MDHRFLVDSPLMWIDKAETCRMAEALNEASVGGAGLWIVGARGDEHRVG